MTGRVKDERRRGTRPPSGCGIGALKRRARRTGEAGPPDRRGGPAGPGLNSRGHGAVAGRAPILTGPLPAPTADRTLARSAPGAARVLPVRALGSPSPGRRIGMRVPCVLACAADDQHRAWGRGAGGGPAPLPAWGPSGASPPPPAAPPAAAPGADPPPPPPARPPAAHGASPCSRAPGQ